MPFFVRHILFQLLLDTFFLIFRKNSTFEKSIAVVIISQKVINEFANKYPLSAYPLSRWYKQTLNADWKDFNDVKLVLNATDAIGNDRYVFNIGGNKYRLVALIHFTRRTLYIRFIGTHLQYDEICKAGTINTI